MCYNSEISFSFATVGILTTAYIYAYKSDLTKTGIQYILLFYAFMELLQGFQYFFVNQCSNAVNVFLTEVAYILVIVQPLMWNSFFYFNSPEKDKVIFRWQLDYSQFGWHLMWQRDSCMEKPIETKQKRPNRLLPIKCARKNRKLICIGNGPRQILENTTRMQ